MVKKVKDGDTKRCPRCKETKPLVGPDGEKNFYSNGYCCPCGRVISAEPHRGGKSKPKTAPKVVSKRIAKHQHRVGADPLGRMVINLFSIRIKDHAGVDHDLVLNFDTVKQLMTELQDCTR